MKMKPKALLAVAVSLVAAAGLVTSFSASAQSAPPSYTASPEVYKLLSENDEFRVIQATWKPGQGDVSHSHAGALVAYNLTDCKIKLTSPDGKSRVNEGKRGSVGFVPMITSHTAKNIGTAKCQILLVERK
jgi:oxalate decarboxylase/phosphoglucose isomerase-like protein (cupin superfamily)